MRKLALLILVSLFTFSCGQLDELTEFEMDYETSFTVPGNIPQGSTDTLTTPSVETNVSEQFSNNNTEKGLVDEIVLSELNLTIDSPQDGDFSFLDEIKIYMKAGDMEDALLVSKSDIPQDVGNTLELDPTSDNLKDYLFEDSYQMKVVLSTDETIQENHEITISTVFTVDAEVL